MRDGENRVARVHGAVKRVLARQPRTHLTTDEMQAYLIGKGMSVAEASKVSLRQPQRPAKPDWGAAWEPILDEMVSDPILGMVPAGMSRKHRIRALEAVAESKTATQDQQRKAWDEAGKLKAFEKNLARQKAEAEGNKD